MVLKNFLPISAVVLCCGGSCNTVGSKYPNKVHTNVEKELVILLNASNFFGVHELLFPAEGGTKV